MNEDETKVSPLSTVVEFIRCVMLVNNSEVKVPTTSGVINVVAEETLSTERNCVTNSSQKDVSSFSHSLSSNILCCGTYEDDSKLDRIVGQYWTKEGPCS